MAPSFIQMLSSGLLAASVVNLPQVAAIDPKCAPGGNFDLSHWKLQLPIGSPGKPKTISTEDLKGCNGFQNFDYFFTVGVLAKVPKGQRFHYEIRYEKNKLSVSINDCPYKELDTFDLNSPDSYFKAGNYNQGEGPTNTHFFAIIVTH